MRSWKGKTRRCQGELTKLLDVAGVPAQERARRLVTSIYYRAFDSSHGLPSSQYICTCKYITEHLQCTSNQCTSFHFTEIVAPLMIGSSAEASACRASRACNTCTG